MIITCLKELEERKELQYGDKVIFAIEEETIEYNVCSWFLRNLDDPKHINNKIFTILGIDQYEIATEAYGYRSAPDSSDDRKKFIINWPNSKPDDFAALTRLVKVLYIKIEVPLPEPDYILSRFEILDL